MHLQVAVLLSLLLPIMALGLGLELVVPFLMPLPWETLELNLSLK
nr:hypothetical protein Q903MT_gene23 [Picea sitchensis]